jgi:hypothetical protein
MTLRNAMNLYDLTTKLFCRFGTFQKKVNAFSLDVASSIGRKIDGFMTILELKSVAFAKLKKARINSHDLDFTPSVGLNACGGNSTATFAILGVGGCLISNRRSTYKTRSDCKDENRDDEVFEKTHCVILCIDRIIHCIKG